MRKTTISIEDFKKYMVRVRCINLFHFKLIALPKLSEIGQIERRELDAVDDFALFENNKTVWYENEDHDLVSWDVSRARNLSVKELVNVRADSPVRIAMTDTIDELRDGLTRYIEIVSISDTTLGETVIVEGGRRAAALYYLYDQEKEAIHKILSSPYTVINIVFSSPAAALLFPCDFINIFRDVKMSDSAE